MNEFQSVGKIGGEGVPNDGYPIKVPGRRLPEPGIAGPLYCGGSAPDCSATMYLAYQSAQFASCWPVRFSCSP